MSVAFTAGSRPRSLSSWRAIARTDGGSIENGNSARPGRRSSRVDVLTGADLTSPWKARSWSDADRRTISAVSGKSTMAKTARWPGPAPGAMAEDAQRDGTGMRKREIPRSSNSTMLPLASPASATRRNVM